MKLRDYDHEKDRTAVHRIWREIGWIGREKHEEEALDIFIGCGRALVAEKYRWEDKVREWMGYADN